MGSQSSKLVDESQQQEKKYLVQISSTSSQTSGHNFIAKKDLLVNTHFIWSYGGKIVFVTGTFSNWKDHILMQSQGTDFRIYVKLPRGIHEYKYIVDGEWRFSPDDKKIVDEKGNTNNIIDTSLYEDEKNEESKESLSRPVPPIEQKRKKKLSSFDQHFDKLVIQTSHNQKHAFELQSEKYGLISPPPSKQRDHELQFNSKAPLCPPHLKDVYFISQKEKSDFNIWKQSTQLKERLSKEEIEKQNNISKSEIYSHLFDGEHSLAPPQHVTTYFLNSKKENDNNLKNLCLGDMQESNKLRIKDTTSTALQLDLSKSTPHLNSIQVNTEKKLIKFLQHEKFN